MDQKENWIKVAGNIDEISFADNNIATIHIEEKTICLARTGDSLKACSAKCPHAGGDLSEAFLDKKENIVCPVHGYRFSINSGRDTNGEGYFLKIYKIKETEEGIFIKLE
ncbi:MAG: Rieske 2Fe-2S domain-containing protein [Bacteroidota bacterium]|nr:Rieske 2Fe-2S domain-containing protein [Bacteroidota bacterium]